MTQLLRKIDFGNEAGDDVDFADLRRYFHEQPIFRPFILPERSLVVSTAKKGVGKSALLRWTEGKLRELYPDDLVIRCRGADLTRPRFGLNTPASNIPNERIRDWMIRICALVNRELASRIGFALADDRMTLIESAELDGYKSRNLVGGLLDRLGRMIPTGHPEKMRIKEEVELLKRNQDRRIWFLIDDLDATFQNTTEELLELSTFFSAMRYLAQDVQGIRFRATMRTDVWPLIRRYDESLDKLEQYVTEIQWTRDDFRSILYKRIKSQLEILNLPTPVLPDAPSHQTIEQTFISLVLEDKMDWSDKHVPGYQVLYTLSYQRPRWGIQLCKLGQAYALGHQDSIIRKSHIDAIWGEYGNRRIADLVAEHKHQCRNVEELILAFRGATRLMTRDQLFEWINRRVVTHVNVQIEGSHMKSPRDIAQFLYRIGFIIARSDGETGYEHYSFDQMPDFLGSRTNEDFGVQWEIHPCYREALDIEKVDISHRARFGKMRGGNSF